eukprot:5041832-Amphidinium_carterae.2
MEGVEEVGCGAGGGGAGDGVTEGVKGGADACILGTVREEWVELIVCGCFAVADFERRPSSSVVDASRRWDGFGGGGGVGGSGEGVIGEVYGVGVGGVAVGGPCESVCWRETWLCLC